MKLAMLPLMTATAFLGSSPFAPAELEGVTAIALLGATLLPFPGFGREPIAEGDSDVDMTPEMEARLETELAARATRICGRYTNVCEGQHENQIA